MNISEIEEFQQDLDNAVKDYLEKNSTHYAKYAVYGGIGALGAAAGATALATGAGVIIPLTSLWGNVIGASAIYTGAGAPAAIISYGSGIFGFLYPTVTPGVVLLANTPGFAAASFIGATTATTLAAGSIEVSEATVKNTTSLSPKGFFNKIKKGIRNRTIGKSRSDKIRDELKNHHVVTLFDTDNKERLVFIPKEQFKGELNFENINNYLGKNEALYMKDTDLPVAAKSLCIPKGLFKVISNKFKKDTEKHSDLFNEIRKVTRSYNCMLSTQKNSLSLFNSEAIYEKVGEVLSNFTAVLIKGCDGKESLVFINKSDFSAQTTAEDIESYISKPISVTMQESMAGEDFIRVSLEEKEKFFPIPLENEQRTTVYLPDSLFGALDTKLEGNVKDLDELFTSIAIDLREHTKNLIKETPATNLETTELDDWVNVELKDSTFLERTQARRTGFLSRNSHNFNYAR
ncbi:hypothetical protein [Rickettsiales endosymbiont of Stachyamoeba lipophora]|uniref:hypothetical protein n=1 Tax=Rickettsiales endosymbiont of Stachyamoeba lipophora TaxID=2486578 RepID=UPI000F650504|nr:hypothetical protein [Rickettsiales endosymbiont of Stachyamoeba lipophora]AZL15601.1 hypothetical protein EF513_03430 [Rickettsiales endosymbiont of Stachyamoeba lipophora]